MAAAPNAERSALGMQCNMQAPSPRPENREQLDAPRAERSTPLDDSAIRWIYQPSGHNLKRADKVCGPGMRRCESISKMDGSLIQTSQTAWKGVRHRRAFLATGSL
jgi:hypothetical protein